MRTHATGVRMTRLARAAVCPLVLLGTICISIVVFAGPAIGKASHAGWPSIDGHLKMHKTDRSGTIRGSSLSDELLGGHGNDVIIGGTASDVIWGDYKPCCQPTHQHDVLLGGNGRDFIYASHGYNHIEAGAGNDAVHGHFGHGKIDCGSGHDVLDVSHRSRHRYKIRHCERIR